MNLKLTLEYDGTGFRGWARQPGERTVEGVMREALDATYPGWDGLAVAGRTDAGVHALGQVASVSVEGGPPVDRAAEALNAALPGRRRRRRLRASSGRAQRSVLGALPLLPISSSPPTDAFAARGVDARFAGRDRPMSTRS